MKLWLPQVAEAAAQGGYAAIDGPEAFILAQEGSPTQSYEIDDGKTAQTPDKTVSDRTTGEIVAQLEGVKGFCENVAPEYRVDCLSERLKNVARTLPTQGDYDTVRRALNVASLKLNRLSRQNRSKDLPRAPARVTEGGTTTSTARDLTPVSTDAVERTNQAASAILQEAETKLLRSSENSTRRKIQFQRIADAIGSNKVLLRSS
ncbi:MAG: hypothetical protein WCD16_01980 [Paracoccaceae bacterium]